LLEEGQSVKMAVLGNELDVGTVLNELALVSHVDVVLLLVLGETPSLGDDDFLSAGEFVLGSSQGLDGVLNVRLLGSHGDQDLADPNSGSLTLGLAEGTSHSGLESICTSA